MSATQDCPLDKGWRSDAIYSTVYFSYSLTPWKTGFTRTSVAKPKLFLSAPAPVLIKFPLPLRELAAVQITAIKNCELIIIY
jgi:hypothetical protein